MVDARTAHPFRLMAFWEIDPGRLWGRGEDTQALWGKRKTSSRRRRPVGGPGHWLTQRATKGNWDDYRDGTLATSGETSPAALRHTPQQNGREGL